MLEEVGARPASYATVNRRLPVYAQDDFRERLAAACAAHAGLGPATLVLYDVSTLYFETDTGDGFRESGYSKERRLEPQITIGLLTAAHGFPLMVHAFEGNTAETTTMLPVLRAFMAAHRLTDVTVVADTGMVSAANKKGIEDAGLSFILGATMPFVPFVVDEWRREHPDQDMTNEQIFTQPWPAGPKDKRRDHTIYYQYRSDRARRTLHGLEQQVEKAHKALAGKAAIKRNRFVKLTGGDRSLDQELINKTIALAGIKGYITNLPPETADAAFVINAYHHLFHIEKSFRMSKHDLQARPIYHRKQDSINAHLTIVFAALAISRWTENTTGWSIKKFVRTTRRYRTIHIQAGEHTITAADPVPTELGQALADIHRAAADTH